jgi:hypothetical protein
MKTLVQSSPVDLRPINRRFDISTLPQYAKILERLLFPGQSTSDNARAHWRCVQARSRLPAIL